MPFLEEKKTKKERRTFREIKEEKREKERIIDVEIWYIFWIIQGCDKLLTELKGKKNIQKHLQVLNPSKQTEHIIIHQKRHKLDHSNALDMKSVHTTVPNMAHVQISKHI